jgi:hypothetical protein
MWYCQKVRYSGHRRELSISIQIHMSAARKAMYLYWNVVWTLPYDIKEN